MFYLSSPQSNNYFQIGRMRPWDYPIHINEYYEVLIGGEGTVTIVVGSCEYSVTKGKAVIIFPYQPHGFVNKGSGHGYLCTFSPNLVNSFFSQYQRQIPISNLFTLDFSSSMITNESNYFAVKSFLYHVCDQIVSELQFTEVAEHHESLLTNIFTITEKRYMDGDFSLQQLAKILNYSYSYISKQFYKQTGIRYSSYLNQVRIFHAAQMLTAGQNISEIALACGYDNIRSFNRNFKILQGMTPTTYVKLEGEIKT